MDFFGHQDQARRASRRLVWLFAAAVATIIALIYTAAWLLLLKARHGPVEPIDWPLLGIVTAVVVVVVGGAMLFKTAQLKSGGGAVATAMGGRLLDIDPQDPKERMLRNVVEEMAIASGLPVPDIYVLDDEAGINAFAAGWTPSDAAVAVTRGGLEAFTRDELQGVIAHEFSHVFHGDMRLNIKLMGTLFGILCIAVVGRILLHSGARGGRRNNAGGVVLFGLALVAIGYVGVFFARLIQAAVSRQREFLADASAVQYTRNPRGIGLALARIGGHTSVLQSAHTEETSHMLFACGLRSLGGAMATHPPLEQRIERVLPGYLSRLQQADGDFVQAVGDEAATAGVSGFAGAAPAAPGTSPDALLRSVGDPQPEHVREAFELLQHLPLELTAACHAPDAAAGLVYALLLDDDDAARARQLQLLQEHAPTQRIVAHDLFAHLDALPRSRRLALLELSMPALRRTSADDRRTLLRHARALAMTDDHLSPFEFALLKALERHLQLPGTRPRRPGSRIQSLTGAADEVAVLLSVIAHADAAHDPDRAAGAFARGRDLLQMPHLQLVPVARACAVHLDPVLDALDDVSPLGKRNLLRACAEVAAADGYLSDDETDLVRAIGDLLDCPVPLAVARDASPAP